MIEHCEACDNSGRRPHERASGPPINVDCMCPGGTLMRLAASRSRMESTSATPEQVDLVVQLQAVSRAITEHCRHVLRGEDDRWTELADVLNGAATACRTQVVIMVEDAGDAGGR